MEKCFIMGAGQIARQNRMTGEGQVGGDGQVAGECRVARVVQMGVDL